MPELEGRPAIERRFARRLSRTFREQRNVIAGLLGGIESVTDLPIDALSDTEIAMGIVLLNETSDIFTTSATALMNSQPIGVDFGLINERAAQWAGQYSSQLVTNISNTTRNALQRKVEAGIRQGLSKDEIAKSLESLFSPVRSELIATTETTSAAVQGELEVAKELGNIGVQLRSQWATSFDERVCPICSPLDGMFQGDGWTSPPPAHPRCRCWINHVGITV